MRKFSNIGEEATHLGTSTMRETRINENETKSSSQVQLIAGRRSVMMCNKVRLLNVCMGDLTVCKLSLNAMII